MKISSVVGRKCVYAWLVLLVVCSVEVEGSSKDANANANAVKVNKPLQFASPLQTLTLFPKSSKSESESESETTSMSPRKAFLPKFVAGLSAERRMKEKLSSQRKESLLASLNDDDDDDVDNNENGSGGQEESLYSNDWDKQSEAADRQRLKMEGLRMERAHDRAIAKYEQQLTNKPSNKTHKKNSPYQFVGVIHSTNQKNNNKEKNKQEIQWFARKKKNHDTWNVRLVHVNKDALLRDLFVRGKIDIYGEYVNTGNFITENTKNNDNHDTQTQPSSSSSSSPQFGRPLLQTKYSVKPRSWRNLWNFSPKHMFTDSSGSFWRERRLSPGLYTDGNYVYESTYRYSDGKNGMKPLSTLDAFMKSKTIASPIKQTIIKKLKHDSPDVVIEE